MADSWLVGDRHAAASDRILDAAGDCFLDKGVTGASIGDIARAAGCSRPTVYRYFEDKDALRIAFIHREARRLGARLASEVKHVQEPADRLVTVVQNAVEAVRTDPVLSAWFSDESSGITARLAGSSSVIESLVLGMVEGVDETDRSLRAHWLVRVILSFLLIPAETREMERELLDRFVIPVIIPSAGLGRSPARHSVTGDPLQISV